jgi:hypothetical protein
MPKKRTQKEYFGEVQEKAVIRYLQTESEQEKNEIFNEYLREPLTIMIDSIIRRYKLYRKGVEFVDLHADTMSFLITKVEKYDHEKNHKAYSYFGTICKNYLMGAIQKDVKDFNRTLSYNDISSDVEDNIKLSYVIDDVPLDFKNVVVKLKDTLENFVEEDRLNDNERKLGYALLEIFTNFDQIFQVGDGNKFNKNLILLSLREMTSLSTKEIRISMKKFKKIYDDILSDFLN